MPNARAHARHSNLRALRREIPPLRKKPSTTLRVLLGALAGVAVLSAAVLVYRSRPLTEETVALTRGSVEITYAVEGLVVRREQIYTAPVAGQVRRVAAEGQRVRVGSPIARIVPAGTPQAAPPAAQPAAPVLQGDGAVRREIDNLAVAIYNKAAAINQAKAGGDTAGAARLQDELDQLAVRQQELTLQLGRSQPSIITPPPAQPQDQPAGPVLGELTARASGLVIYQTDGLESRLVMGQEKDWKPSLIKSLTAEPRTLGENVQMGDPVVKVVDNLSFSLVAVVPEAALTRLGDSDWISIRFDGREGAPVAARITRQVKEGGEVLLILTAPVLPEELAHQRRFRATLVMGGHDGLIVPRTAIDVRDGLQGVWVQEGTETRFHPVRVLGGNDELLALETDLPVGARVLKDAPTWMR